MSELVFCRTPTVLTYEKRVGLGFLCKLLRREWLPAIVYESLQYARIDSKKGSSVFVQLLAKSLAWIYLARQCIMLYLMSLSRYIMGGPFHCDLKAMDWPARSLLGGRRLDSCEAQPAQKPCLLSSGWYLVRRHCVKPRSVIARFVR